MQVGLVGGGLCGVKSILHFEDSTLWFSTFLLIISSFENTVRRVVLQRLHMYSYSTTPKGEKADKFGYWYFFGRLIGNPKIAFSKRFQGVS